MTDVQFNDGSQTFEAYRANERLRDQQDSQRIRDEGNRLSNTYTRDSMPARLRNVEATADTAQGTARTTNSNANVAVATEPERIGEARQQLRTATANADILGSNANVSVATVPERIGEARQSLRSATAHATGAEGDAAVNQGTIGTRISTAHSQAEQQQTAALNGHMEHFHKIVELINAGQTSAAQEYARRVGQTISPQMLNDLEYRNAVTQAAARAKELHPNSAVDQLDLIKRSIEQLGMRRQAAANPDPGQPAPRINDPALVYTIPGAPTPRGTQDRQPFVIGEDYMGNKQYGIHNDAGDVIDLSTGRPIYQRATPNSPAAPQPGQQSNAAPAGQGQPGAATTAGAPSAPMNLANINHNLVGEEYLKQFPPEVQTAVRDYLAGRVTPSGNPRRGFTQLVSTVARKYGSDIGVPADDATFAQRRTYRNQLANANPSSVGGQRTSLNTALGHAADVGEYFLAQNNLDPIGQTDIARGVNELRQRMPIIGSANRDRANSVEEAVDRLAGEVGKLYSGSSGGGVAEREATRARLRSNMSPVEFAGALDAVAHMMKSRLQALESQRDEILGPGGTDVQMITANGRAAVARIENVVRQLRGQSSEATPAPAPAPAFAGTPPAVQTATAAPPARQQAPAQERPEMMSPGDGGRPLNIQMPARPSNIPQGPVSWSPATGMFRHADGSVYDAQGNRVQ